MACFHIIEILGSISQGIKVMGKGQESRHEESQISHDPIEWHSSHEGLKGPRLFLFFFWFYSEVGRKDPRSMDEEQGEFIQRRFMVILLNITLILPDLTFQLLFYHPAAGHPD
eukprot:g16066.t1